MEKLGREMVRYCAGLPLAILILGGILVTKPSLIEWEKVYHDSLSSLEKGKGLGQTPQKQLFDVLSRSYNDLPPQLKPCFLYLGKFSEDEWIEAETLYQLWIAEGMVLSSDKREGETMMQVAESYLGELVHKSMVRVRYDYTETSPTKFRNCYLHDVMRDLSLSQAKAEDLFQAIDLREKNDFQSSILTYTRQLVLYYDDKYSTKVNSYFVKKLSHWKYRSMLLMNDSPSSGLSLFLSNFRLLRVLALEGIYVHGTDLGRVIGSLVYLRYLSARKSHLMILPWIQRLVLLQTLKLNLNDVLSVSPMSSNILEKMAHLQHLYLPGLSSDSSRKLRKDFKLRFKGLSKLETLENFDAVWCEVKDLKNLTSLQKLGIIVHGSYDDVEEILKCLSVALSSPSCVRYLDLATLIHGEGLRNNNGDMIRQFLWDHKFILQDLRLYFEVPELATLFKQQQRNGTHIDVSLFRITNLVLCRTYLEEDPMPVVEKIPTLRILNLFSSSYVGKEMVCSAMGFPQLVELGLAGLPNLVKWKVEEGSMPFLSFLLISTCRKLEELPQGLKFLRSLGKSWLVRMGSDFNYRICGQGPDFYKVSHIPDLQIQN